MSGKNIEILSNDGELTAEEYQTLAQKTIPELIMIIANLKRDCCGMLTIIEDEWSKRANEWTTTYKTLETKYQQLSNKMKN